MHNYPGPGVPKLEEKRAAVLGEFGGLGLPVKGHTWQDEKNWGYAATRPPRNSPTPTSGCCGKLHPHDRRQRPLRRGLYPDDRFEIEVNGLMTYDRAHGEDGPGRHHRRGEEALHAARQARRRRARSSSRPPRRWSRATRISASGRRATN